MRAEQSSAAVVVAVVTPTKQDDLDVIEALGETAAGIESAVGDMFFCEPTDSRYAGTGCHSYGTINWASDPGDDLEVDEGKERSTGDKIRDLHENPEDWTKAGEPRVEPATGKPYKGGLSVEKKLINTKTGETLTEHTIYGPDGRILHGPHYR